MSELTKKSQSGCSWHGELSIGATHRIDCKLRLGLYFFWKQSYFNIH
jgi:hypothetical protein